MRVLLVDDDLIAARDIALMLRSGNLTVDTTDTGQEALELLRRYNYDVVILDLLLPDMEGYEVVRRMRAARLRTPVLILSRLCPVGAKVKGFDIGADDFISEPFDQAELMARVQAVVRRSRGYSQPTLRLGNLQLNPDSRDVFVSGAAVSLTAKEYSILELLMLHKGTALTKEAFLSHLYGGMDEPEAKIIDVFIFKLRKKLSIAGAGDLIGAVWGRGYMIRDPANQHDADRPWAYQDDPKTATDALMH
jgi:two-component system cell cycle response regulator CtrA